VRTRRVKLRIADCGWPIEDRVAAGPSRLRPAASGPRGPVVQTNPIRRSQSCKTVQTKPIAGYTRWVGPHGARGETCKTKPIPGHAARDEAWGMRGNRAKQTQFRGVGRLGPGAAVQTNPISGGAGWVGPQGAWARICKTNPIRGRTGRGAMAPNKPNFGERTGRGQGGPRYKQSPFAADRTHRVKQSQFPPGRCRARACPELAEGTPNPRSGRGQAPRRAEGNCAKQSQFPATRVGPGAESIVRNKANFQGSSRSDGYGTDNGEPSAAICHHLPAIPLVSPAQSNGCSRRRTSLS
jgi:hypothetical protein